MMGDTRNYFSYKVSNSALQSLSLPRYKRRLLKNKEGGVKDLSLLIVDCYLAAGWYMYVCERRFM